MSSRSVVTVVTAALLLGVCAGSASAAEKNMTFDPGSQPVTLAGSQITGLNVTSPRNPFGDNLVDGACEKSGPVEQTPFICETTLLHITGTQDTEQAAAQGGNVRLDLDVGASDFDLRVYASDASGTELGFLGTGSGASRCDYNGLPESRQIFARGAGDDEYFFLQPSLSTEQGGQYFLIQVRYYTVIDDAYRLTASWSKKDSSNACSPGETR